MPVSRSKSRGRSRTKKTITANARSRSTSSAVRSTGKKPSRRPRATSSMSRGRQMMRVEGHGAGGTFTQLTNVRPCPSYYKPYLKLAKQTQQSVAGQAIVSATGLQGVVDVSLGSGDSMRVLMTSAANTEVLALGPTQTIFLERMELLWTIRNDTNNEIVADIYDLIARHDQVETGPASEPSLAWALGDSNASGTDAYRIPGATPFSSPTFNQFFKVVKVHHLIMPAGSTHEHRINVVVNKLFNAAFWAAEGQPDMRNMMNFTRSCMIAWRGAPCAITTGATTISNTRLDTTIFKKYTFTIPSISQSVVSAQNYLSVSGTLSLVNDETGVVDGLQTAA